MRTCAFATIVLLAGFVAASLPAYAAGPSQPVAVKSGLCVSGGGQSFAPTLSGDGRFVAFLSHANNLVTNDDSAPHLDVFRHDLSSGQTVLVSVNTAGNGGGNGNSAFASISSNGQCIAFSSAASDLVSSDTNGVSDVFVRDLLSGVTTRVGLEPDDLRFGGIPCVGPLISADGRWVVFEGWLPIAYPRGSSNNIFARDLVTGTNVLVSVNSLGTAPGNGKSGSPAMTPDARFVAFISRATDLGGRQAGSKGDVYVRDLQGGVTRWVSEFLGTNTTVSQAYGCLNPVLSADGKVACYKATNAGWGQTLVLRHDNQTGMTTVLASNSLVATYPAISADGRFVAFEDGTNIFLWDAQTGDARTVDVSIMGSGPGNGPSHTPVLTPDGTKICFLSAATDLVTNQSNGQVQLYVRDLVAGTTRLVSANLNGAASVDLSSTIPAMSDDGRWVAFDSVAADLVSGDFNQASDVFVRDLDAETTRLASKADPTLAGRTAAGASSFAAAALVGTGTGITPHAEIASMGGNAVTADGRFVVFSSYDSDLIAGDTNGWQDVFVRDLQAGTVIPASIESDEFPTNRSSSQATISADGQYVFFTTPSRFASVGADDTVGLLYRRDLLTQTNLLLADHLTGGSRRHFYPFSSSGDGRLVAFQAGPYESSDVFLRDFETGTNQLISMHWQGTGRATGCSGFPLFSPDGRSVLFASNSRDLVPQPPASSWSLWIYDLSSRSNSLVNVISNGPAISYIAGATFSPDSRKVAFAGSMSGPGVPPTIYVCDLVARTITAVCDDCSSPSLNEDGTLVAFEGYPNTGLAGRIYVKDLSSGVSTLIASNLISPAYTQRLPACPSISPDGRYVVFTSRTSDLVPNDNNNASDIFIHDRLLNVTLLASMNRFGTGSGNGHSTRPVLGADGRTVLFLSYASDLAEGDFNNQRDVFVLRVPGADTDHDGLDDEWEVAYFGDLSRDGTGDFDGDGMTDRQEFLAGTDPTNRGSVLSVLKLTRLSGGSTTILWSAVPGRTYRVQFKYRLNDPSWRDFPAMITPTTTTGVFTDDSLQAFGQRYYRVTLVL